MKKEKGEERFGQSAKNNFDSSLKRKKKGNSRE